MDRLPTTPSKKRLLLNAEPFGFGPTAAIAAFFPFLREAFEVISYVGRNHTLDLQRNLAYNHVYDLSRTDSEVEERILEDVFAHHDIFFTACDFSLAERARQAGLTVIIYDPLLWFWKGLPSVVYDSNLYLVQDFIGVADRIREEYPRLQQAKIVPPIISSDLPVRSPNHVLINLGGLQNPFWSVDDAASYAAALIDALKISIPQEETVIIATSNAIAERLGDPAIKSYSLEAMQRLLLGAKYAFMTPGLGNIYDSARYDLPTIWLPPANDSQGQQAVLLQNEGMLDAFLDWDKFLAEPINYFGLQPDVLTRITESTRLIGNPATDNAPLVDACIQAIESVRRLTSSRTSRLLDVYGIGGAQIVAEHVIEFAQR